MAVSLLSFSPSSLSFSKSHLLSVKRPSIHSLTALNPSVKCKGSDSIEPSDRLLSAVCYLYPFLDGVKYGRYVLSQFPFIQTPLKPLIPLISLFSSSPLIPIATFCALYFAIVRNPNSFSRYVRFNTMQAIVLDVLLIFPDLLERNFNPRDEIGLGFLESLDSTVFLFLLISLIYGSSSCLIGRVPRLPIVADAADRQVM